MNSSVSDFPECYKNDSRILKETLTSNLSKIYSSSKIFKETEASTPDFPEFYSNRLGIFEELKPSVSDFPEFYKNGSRILKEVFASDFPRIYSNHSRVVRELESSEFSKAYGICGRESRVIKEMETSASDFPEVYRTNSRIVKETESSASDFSEAYGSSSRASKEADMLCQISCNACAAFFRRSVAGNRTYTCPKNFNCTIRYDIPKRLCRACRLRKCEKVGMKAEDVQSAQKPGRSRIPPLIPPLPLPLIQQLITYGSGKQNSLLVPQYSEVSMSFDSFVEWHSEEAQKLATYLNFFNIGISPGTTSETLLNLCFLMKVFNEIMDLARVAASCSLTDADWALITHSSILATIFQSTSAVSVAAQFNQLRVEIEVFYLKPKLDFINGLIDVLLSLRATSENAIQALKLSGKKNIWEIVFEKKFVLAKS
ncbi:hypothetical protein FO519_007106 [Halicephalobus sp. NKZ332]|nr:hypothetical protein FO519_007106 [Halicephalobus sp. NKZ332]